MKILALLSSQRLTPSIKGSTTNKILESEQDKFFHQLFEHFPKLKLENLSPKEVEIWAERYMQIHSLRCKKCKNDLRCKKLELLINIGEIL